MPDITPSPAKRFYQIVVLEGGDQSQDPTIKELKAPPHAWMVPDGRRMFLLTVPQGADAILKELK